MNTKDQLSPAHLHILQHSVGVDEYGQGRMYRNHYVTGPGCDNFVDCQALSAAGLMKDHGPQGDLTGGMHCFTVTEAGRAAIVAQSPKPPKKTRSQLMYQEYLDADCDMSFGEYLKWRWANRYEIRRLQERYS